MKSPTHRRTSGGLALSTLALWVGAALAAPQSSTPPTNRASEQETTMHVQYLEIVTPALEETCAALAELHGVTFTEPDAGLGSARTASLAGGGRIGVRAPMHAQEEPVVRPYVLVDDIEAATRKAEAAGAEFMMKATEIPGQGRFAIYLLGGIQHGIWEK